MLVYKFRSLGSENDFLRAKSILETGHFWCSNFNYLNDPMEGVYRTSDLRILQKKLQEKLQYKICSFSGEKGFSNPTLWGYYANGFKGIAIGIETSEIEVKKVSYTPGTPELAESVEKILTNKLLPWQHEDEWRFLIKSNNNFHQVGEIKSVCFGKPYGDVINTKEVINYNQNLIDYYVYQKELVKIVQSKGIKYSFVKIVGGQVVVN